MAGSGPWMPRAIRKAGAICIAPAVGVSNATPVLVLFRAARDLEVIRHLEYSRYPGIFHSIHSPHMIALVLGGERRLEEKLIAR
jgi:hypothetical protein